MEAETFNLLIKTCFFDVRTSLETRYIWHQFRIEQCLGSSTEMIMKKIQFGDFWKENMKDLFNILKNFSTRIRKAIKFPLPAEESKKIITDITMQFWSIANQFMVDRDL